MLSGGLVPRVGAYLVLALGFWLLFQAFERSNILSGIVGGTLIIVGMYLMTGVWREMFAKFGSVDKIRKENDSSDNTAKNPPGEIRPSDTSDGSDKSR